MAWLGILVASLALIAARLWRALARQSKANRVAAATLRATGEGLAIRAANSRLKLNALSESSGAAILMLDARGRVVHRNVEADAIWPDDSGREGVASGVLREIVDKALSSRQGSSSDLQHGNRQLRAAAYPFAQGLSGVPEVMVVLTDVTDIRRLESVRREFVANVSHELRTPLTSIRAMAESLRDGALKDTKVSGKFLRMIVKESDRLSRITEELLSSPDSGPGTRTTLDFSALVAEVAARFEARAQDAGLDLELAIVPGLQLYGSRDQLEQVVVNLLDNAIKYTPGGGKVGVSVTEDAGHVQIAVRDTGVGIPESDLPHVFERFYRADRAPSFGSGGSGLGLSIVKGIVERHGGRVEVVSSTMTGSTFAVLLPKGN